MKTKALFFSLITLFILSCKSDDESSSTPFIPESEKLIESITGNSLFYEFEYNSDKTVQSLNLGNYYLFNFSYQNGKISSILMLVEGQNMEYFFEYDNNGRISSFSKDDEITPVTYNAAQNYYLYQKPNGDEFSVFLNENQDIFKILGYDAEYDETESLIMLYENSAKGVLTNSNNITVPVVLTMGDVVAGYILYPVSNKPVKTISAEGIGNITFENLLDQDGFITESSFIPVGETNPVITKYSYTQL